LKLERKKDSLQATNYGIKIGKRALESNGKNYLGLRPWAPRMMFGKADFMKARACL